MEKGKFTPGPWEVRSGIVFSVNGDKDESNIPYAIAMLTEELRPVAGTYQFHNHEQYKANARLIAAAPELLESLGEISIVEKEDGYMLVLDNNPHAMINIGFKHGPIVMNAIRNWTIARDKAIAKAESNQ